MRNELFGHDFNPESSIKHLQALANNLSNIAQNLTAARVCREKNVTAKIQNNLENTQKL